MKICFINVGTIGINDDKLDPNLGALYIASNLRKNGYNDILFYDIMGCKTEKEVKQKINEIPIANIYSFTTYCTNYGTIKECIVHIRKSYPHSIIILGGPNATALPKYTFEDSGCNFVVVGEGEDAFIYILKSLEIHKYIENIIYGIPREDINTLPNPSWDLIDLNNYTRSLNGKHIVSILTSRGCPNKCTHCNSIIMGAGRKIRYRSVKNIIDEIKYLQTLGYDSFRFADDNFTIRPKLHELLSEIKKLNISYRVFGRIEQLTEENCRLLSESGCKHIAIGLESLDNDNLKFLNKQVHIDIDKHLQNVRRFNMVSRIYFIVGLPYDTDETIEKYFFFASLLPFDEFIIYPLLPYPGTVLWSSPEKYGYTIIDFDFTKYFQISDECGFVLNHKNFNCDDVKRWYNMATTILEKSKIILGKSEVAK